MANRAPLNVAPADPMITYRPARFSARPVAAMQQILPIGEAAAILGEAFESTDLLFAATSNDLAAASIVKGRGGVRLDRPIATGHYLPTATQES
jgi:hypothetical protein